MVSLTRVLQHESEWTMDELQNVQTLEKEMNANVHFFVVNDDNGFCVDGVYVRQYPLVMLKDNKPMLIVDGSKQIMKESSTNCNIILDDASSNDIPNSNILQALINE